MKKQQLKEVVVEEEEVEVALEVKALDQKAGQTMEVEVEVARVGMEVVEEVKALDLEVG